MFSIKTLFLIVAVVFNSSITLANDSGAVSLVESVKVTQTNAGLDTSNAPSPVLETFVCQQAVPITSANYQEAAALFLNVCNPLKEQATSCTGVFGQTNKWCHTEKNENIATMISQLQMLMGAAQGITNSCSKFAKAMDLSKKGMALYTTACGAAQVACSNSCSSALKLLQETKAAAEKARQLVQTKCNEKITLYNSQNNIALANLEKTACLDSIAELAKAITTIAPEESLQPATIASKVKICKVDVPTLLTGAIVNLGALAQSQAMAEQCKKQTETPTTTPTTTPTDTVVDCGVGANADKPVCICKANPRLKGCEGVSTSLATNSTLSNGGSGSTSGKGLSAGIGNGTDAAANKQFPSDLSKTNKNDGSSSGLGNGGGSTAGLTSSSDGTASGPEAQLTKSNLGNASILGGDSGGGGGGGYRFGFGNGNSSAKLGARSIASGTKGKLSAMDWSNQVTSNAGKSNFDKIKVRYIDNRTSLLNK